MGRGKCLSVVQGVGVGGEGEMFECSAGGGSGWGGGNV